MELSECSPSPDVETSSTTRPRDARRLERQRLCGDEVQLTPLEKALAEEQQSTQPPTYSIRERFRTKRRCRLCCILTMIIVLLIIMIPCDIVYSERHRLVGPARTYYLQQRPAVLAAARRMHLQWYWAQATPDISVLEINSGGQGSYLGDWFLVYEEEPPVESGSQHTTLAFRGWLTMLLAAPRTRDGSRSRSRPDGRLRYGPECHPKPLIRLPLSKPRKATRFGMWPIRRGCMTGTATWQLRDSARCAATWNGGVEMTSRLRSQSAR